MQGPTIEQDISAATKALHWAAVTGRIENVKLLLEGGCNPNSTAGGAFPADTPLHSALRNGHSNIAHLLLAHNADPSVASASSRGQTPLHIACEKGLLDAVQALIEKGAPIDVIDASGVTPLTTALWHRHLAVVNFLLERGVDASKGIIAPRNSPLHILCIRLPCDEDTVHVARQLAVRGALLNELDSNGDTPIHSAISLNKLDWLRLFISLGCDVTKPSERGQVPLSMACQKKSLEAAKVLLEAGADVHLTNATQFDWDNSVVRELFNNGGISEDVKVDQRTLRNLQA